MRRQRRNDRSAGAIRDGGGQAGGGERSEPPGKGTAQRAKRAEARGIAVEIGASVASGDWNGKPGREATRTETSSEKAGANPTETASREAKASEAGGVQTAGGGDGRERRRSRRVARRRRRGATPGRRVFGVHAQTRRRTIERRRDRAAGRRRRSRKRTPAIERGERAKPEASATTGRAYRRGVEPRLECGRVREREPDRGSLR